MSLSPPTLSGALHAEIARRAEGWRDHVGQATRAERNRRAGRAAADIALWLRIAAELGGSAAWHGRDQIEIRGDIAAALSGVDQLEPLRDAADWADADTSIARTLARARESAEEIEAACTRWRGLRLIERAFAAAHARFCLRTTPEERKAAA